MSAHMWFGHPKKMPVTIALALIPSLPRSQLERLVQSLIDRMDEADDDPDLEPNGDERDGINSEDDFWPHVDDGQPGCPIADSDLGADDEGEPCGDETDGIFTPDDYPFGPGTPPAYLTHKWNSHP